MGVVQTICSYKIFVQSSSNTFVWYVEIGTLCACSRTDFLMCSCLGRAVVLYVPRAPSVASSIPAKEAIFGMGNCGKTLYRHLRMHSQNPRCSKSVKSHHFALNMDRVTSFPKYKHLTCRQSVIIAGAVVLCVCLRA